MSIVYNLVGNKFGKLKVLSFSHLTTGKVKSKMWVCLCDCGNKVTKSTATLNFGRTKSCGCLRKDGSRSVTHGQASGGNFTPEYRTWQNMNTRCYNPKTKRFHNHGGRGIIVCERWHKFDNFFADMGKKPSPIHSIDRFPDNDGNYFKENCRWATPKQQAENRSSNRFIEYNGDKMILANWARKFKVNPSSLFAYIERNGVAKAMLHYTNKLN